MGFFRGQYQLQQPLLFIIQCTETIKSVQDWNFWLGIYIKKNAILTNDQKRMLIIEIIKVGYSWYTEYRCHRLNLKFKIFHRRVTALSCQLTGTLRHYAWRHRCRRRTCRWRVAHPPWQRWGEIACKQWECWTHFSERSQHSRTQPLARERGSPFWAASEREGVWRISASGQWVCPWNWRKYTMW